MCNCDSIVTTLSATRRKLRTFSKSINQLLFQNNNITVAELTFASEKEKKNKFSTARIKKAKVQLEKSLITSSLQTAPNLCSLLIYHNRGFFRRCEWWWFRPVFKIRRSHFQWLKFTAASYRQCSWTTCESHNWRYSRHR